MIRSSLDGTSTAHPCCGHAAATLHALCTSMQPVQRIDRSLGNHSDIYRELHRYVVEITIPHLPKNMSACFGFLLMTRVTTGAAELGVGRACNDTLDGPVPVPSCSIGADSRAVALATFSCNLFSLVVTGTLDTMLCTAGMVAPRSPNCFLARCSGVRVASAFRFKS